MGRVVYFILSHTNVPQVVRLIKRIRSEVPSSLVLLHHDATDIGFDHGAILADDSVLVIADWIHAEWAQFSLVEIVFLGLRALDARGVAYDWLVLLSGQDYPVGPLPEFEAALRRSGDGFIEYDEAPRQLLDRYRFRWYRLPTWLELGAVHRVLGLLSRLNERQPFIRFLSGRVGCRVGFAPWRTPLPKGMNFYKGTQWWALSRRALTYVRRFVDENPNYVEHFRRHTMMPDEAFFQTILFNAAHLFTLQNDDRRFTKWSDAASSSPDVLGYSDLAAVEASNAFFARKVDSRVDSKIIDALEAAAARDPRIR